VSDGQRFGAETSDDELVEQARNGNDAALDTLVKRHHASVYRVALSFTRDSDSAQDVVQEAFIKVFRSLDRFRGDASFKTWLMTITANEARGALRKSKRWKETPIDEVAPLTAAGNDPAEIAVAAGESERARAMLERLPEKQRLSISLRIDEGLSFREIGAVIGSSEGAARVNYFHGIRRLRELMT
jgi:RNA polymerase sigma-70 factor, ECF subfamily